MIRAAVKVAKIATQKLEDESNTGKEYAIEGGKKGGAARAQRLTAEERRTIAQDAAWARWKKRPRPA
ncbi:MAG: hypothetical protein OXI53_07090 [Nitrospira sp.]|nr:hypothetical protein [Nitrospira sp.]MDE0405062.1 hypothetical protein [Nitrospira sp.]